ncbi:hypothetical protein ACX80W_11235 [Arthrobacter sp. TMN-37]
MHPQPTLAPAPPPGDATCNPAGRPALDASQAKEQAVVFKALADPNRLRLLPLVPWSTLLTS